MFLSVKILSVKIIGDARILSAPGRRVPSLRYWGLCLRL